MKTTSAVWQTALSLILATGCTSERAKPSAEAEPVHHQATASSPVSPPAPREDLQELAAKPAASFEGEGWQPLFDGKTLAGWRETDFAGRGEVQCQFGLMVLNTGDPFTGINWTNDFPRLNYELALDALRVSGGDFFCGLTVPVGDSFCSLIVGGWGGSLVGISSLDGMDASENETTNFINFQQRRWYRIRLRVTEGRIEAWIDREKLVDVVTTGKRISLRPGDIELSKPFGLACWQTTAALREIKMRRVSSAADPPPKR